VHPPNRAVEWTGEGDGGVGEAAESVHGADADEGRQREDHEGLPEGVGPRGVEAGRSRPGHWPVDPTQTADRKQYCGGFGTSLVWIVRGPLSNDFYPRGTNGRASGRC